MANTFLTPKVIAAMALKILTGNILYRDLVYNDYSSEFVKVGDTVNVRKISPIKSKEFTGNIDKQDITEDSIPVKLDIWRDTSVTLGTKDYTLDLVSFEEQVVKPVIVGLAQDIDENIAAYIAQNAKSNISKTDNPQNLADIANLGKKLDLNKAPKEDRSLVFSVNHKYDYALTDNLSKVSYAGDNQTLREALLGRIYGMTTYMSQSNVATKAETTGTATSFKVAGTKDAAAVALSSVTGETGTVEAGDGFIFEGRPYYFTETKTAAAGAITSVSIDRKLHKAVTAGDTITLIKKDVSVAFQKDAIAFVTRPLELPQGAAKAYVMQDPATGISVRVVISYDINTKTDVLSFDVLYGLKVLRPELIYTLS